MNPDELEAFRAEVAGWLAEHYPAILRHPQADAQAVAAAEQDWLRQRATRGWLAPTWPPEYGGAGYDAERARVLARELRRAGVRPPPLRAGLSLLGPVLLARGSETQKRRHLPGIARDEVRWCQGYSEPGAGSDLASLTTRATLDGEHYVVDGQKIWTSHADQADWMFCLVRTDPDAPKHEGISFLLIDMKSPGIAVAPIRLISGPSAFCQTFFDAVRVPRENLVGRPGDGWAIARELLQHERRALDSIGRGDLGRARSLPELARQQLGEEEGRIADPVLRAQVAQCELDSLALARRSLPRHAALSRFPQMQRDLAFVLDVHTPAGELLAALREAAADWVRSIEVFDDYRGKGMTENQKSLAIRVVMQDTERTLTDQEVDDAVQKLVDAALRQCNASLRV
jgi:alkylation response protein AidB-like acyl-CoA dehydrogenase